MGFEKLAELKRQLVAQAEQEKRAKAPQGKRPPRPGKPQQGGGKKAGPSSAHKDTRKNQAPRDPLLVAIARLQQNFPIAFPRRPDPRVPLKLGIIHDLFAQADKLKLSEDEIKQAVGTWCSGGRYWACLVENAPRLDLDGNPAGAVTAAEAAHANYLARKQRKELAAQRRAESEARKAAQTPAEAQQQAMPVPDQNDEAPANAEASGTPPAAEA